MAITCCHHCPNRMVDCHSKCFAYKKEKEEHEEEKRKEKKAQQENAALDYIYFKTLGAYKTKRKW